jgi:hypothetical protein
VITMTTPTAAPPEERYIATVVPAGYARYAIRLGGVLLGAVDVPVGRGGFYDPANMARRWLLGEELPEPVRFWPVPS